MGERARGSSLGKELEGPAERVCGRGEVKSPRSQSLRVEDRRNNDEGPGRKKKKGWRRKALGGATEKGTRQLLCDGPPKSQITFFFLSTAPGAGVWRPTNGLAPPPTARLPQPGGDFCTGQCTKRMSLSFCEAFGRRLLKTWQALDMITAELF